MTEQTKVDIQPIFICRAQFKEYVGISYSTVYRYLNSTFKGFPKPLILGTKAFYKLEDIKKFVAAMEL